ncbi:MAG: polyamine aminopropyltransferase [Gammaproteobacteria bacterium]|nr:polyamine aminopropyltransferase [Gammaproteobacteria bacterium]
MSRDDSDRDRERARQLLLLGGTFVIAVCGLVYELLLGTLSSYLLGDSVLEFSLVIGLFMTAMGIGSWLSRFVRHNLSENFIRVQIGVGLIGGLSPLVLFFTFAQLESYRPFLFLCGSSIGMLVGLEIPLVVRLLEQLRELRLNISNVLTVDYAGALAASLVFPLVLVPQLGLLRTGLTFGLFNLFVAFLAIWTFRRELKRPLSLAAGTGLAAALLLFLVIQAPGITRYYEDRLYQDEVVYAASSPYQRLVLTRGGERLRLFLNGALQFDTLDEYRYHETLVHPALSLAASREQVLILGGGDGLAAREVLRWDDADKLTLVDLDPLVTGLFARNPLLRKLNDDALNQSRVEVFNQDALRFLRESRQLYDVIIIDLPDPRTPALSKLYTVSFYRLLLSRLSAGGVMVTQATSPLYARKAFWSIHDTIAAAGDLQMQPYHAYIPSFGEWGFVMASRQRLDWERVRAPAQSRFLTADTTAAMTRFPPDMAPVTVKPNRISDHVLMRYYETGWSHWFE